MKTALADIFDQALQRLKAGASEQEVLLAYPEHREELKSLLLTSQALMRLPKNSVPEPAMQRKFMLAPARKAWFAWLKVSKFASLSMGAVLLFTALAGTGYAAAQSMPGQALFSLKKTAERARLAMTTNPVEKANLQMAITKERLSDAEQVFKNPQHKPEQEVAALSELTAETQNTIAAVNSATKAASASQSSSPIVASLSDLSKQQQSLLKDIKPAAQNSEAATNLLAQLKDTESTVQKMVAASNGDTTLTTLGQASSTLDSQQASSTQATSTLGTIKGAATSTASSTPKSETSTTTPNEIKKDKLFDTDAGTTTQETSSQPNPNTAVGAYILEMP